MVVTGVTVVTVVPAGTVVDGVVVAGLQAVMSTRAARNREVRSIELEVTGS